MLNTITIGLMIICIIVTCVICNICNNSVKDTLTTKVRMLTKACEKLYSDCESLKRDLRLFKEEYYTDVCKIYNKINK